MIIKMDQRPQIFMLLLIVINFHEVENVLQLLQGASSIVDIIRNSIEVSKMTKEVIEAVEKGSSTGQDAVSAIHQWATHDSNDAEKNKIMLADMSSRFDSMMKRMDHIHNAITHLPRQIEFNTIRRDLSHSFIKIQDFYNRALECSNDISKYNRVSLQDLSEVLTGLQGDLRHSILEVHRNIAPATAGDTTENFLAMFTQHTQAQGDTLCGQQSPNLYVYNLYKAVIAAESMGQIAECFGYYLQSKLNKVKVYHELRRAQVDRQNRLTDYFKRFKHYLGKASTHLRPCDPMDLIRNVTFIELERLYRKVIVRDDSLLQLGTCRGSCNDINLRPFHSDQFNCRKLSDCVDSDVSRVCTLSYPSSRLYEWIQGIDGKVHGKNDNHCDGDEISIPANSLDRGWTFLCENCMCDCEGFTRANSPFTQSENHALSLMMSGTNTDDNMIVTGIRFGRNREVICIEVKQGKLLAGGEIQEGSEEWLPCSVELNEERNWIDYVVITSAISIVNLDDLKVPKHHVITGAGFLFEERQKEKRIKLKLQYMEFDFASGQLISPAMYLSPPRSRFYGNRVNSQGFRNPLQLSTSRGPATVETQSNGYVQFSVSEFETDAGQMTLPLFEAIDVGSVPSVPLSGVELFYKCTPGYGGFLAFRIYTINYGEYMGGLAAAERLMKNTTGYLDELSTIDNKSS